MSGNNRKSFFSQKENILLLVFMAIYLYLGFVHGSEITDWWTLLVNGGGMNIYSLLNLLALLGMIGCVFVKYNKR